MSAAVSSPPALSGFQPQRDLDREHIAVPERKVAGAASTGHCAHRPERYLVIGASPGDTSGWSVVDYLLHLCPRKPLTQSQYILTYVMDRELGTAASNSYNKFCWRFLCCPCFDPFYSRQGWLYFYCQLLQ